jgi:hypothetical protein
VAIRYAVASGNWSATSTWNGGTLPASTDDVYANGFTVSIDQTITVNSLKKIANASPVIVGGGIFNVTASSTITITAGIVAADSITNSQSILAVTGAVTVTVNANLEGGAGTFRQAMTVANTGAVVTVNGNLVGGSGASAAALHSASNGAQITVNGSVTGGPVAAQVGGANVSSGARLRLSGPLYHGALGNVPVMGGFLILDPATFEYHASDASAWPAMTGADVTLEVIDLGDYPIEADVRDAVVYGPVDQFTGTLVVGDESHRFINVGGVPVPI